MGLLAVIAGSGAGRLHALLGLAPDAPGEAPPATPYGPASAPVRRGRLGDRDLLLLARHGEGHRVPPHRVNYRANLWALRALSADRVVGLGAVGGIAPGFGPRVFAVPDQLVDYTWGRAHTFCDGPAASGTDARPDPNADPVAHRDAELGQVLHVDMTEPYCPGLRSALLAACADAGVPARERATYAVTQGPRLETAAEIDRLERDGCHLVGMTGMPEAGLARELGLCYASLAFVVNWAAGKGAGPIAMTEVEGHLGHCMTGVAKILLALARGG